MLDIDDPKVLCIILFYYTYDFLEYILVRCDNESRKESLLRSNIIGDC
jgi:hypothetical protein